MDVVIYAKTIAGLAHEDQKDASGAPYIERRARVAEHLIDDDEKAVAWLQGVIRDSAVTVEHLIEMGFPKSIVDAVVALTPSDGISARRYKKAVKSNALARTVNAADEKYGPASSVYV